MFQGRYDEAEPLFERAIGIWEGSRGGEHEMAIGLNNLAKLLEAQVRARRISRDILSVPWLLQS